MTESDVVTNSALDDFSLDLEALFGAESKNDMIQSPYLNIFCILIFHFSLPLPSLKRSETVCLARI